MTLRELVAHQTLRGIALKRCVAGNRWRRREVAHAHNSIEEWRGWICLIELKHLNPTTIAHELAHSISGEDDETSEAYLRALHELGGRLERQYK